jgi:hypothetical protein
MANSAYFYNNIEIAHFPPFLSPQMSTGKTETTIPSACTFIIKQLKNKNIFLLLLLCVALVSCNIKPKSGKHLEKSQVISKKPHAEIDSITNVKANNGSSSITPLPFGSKYLSNFKYEKRWITDSNDKVTDPTANDFLDYYQKAGYVKASRFSKDIISVENIPLEDDVDLFKRKLKLDYRYRLPDIGPYQCYYTYNEDILGTPKDIEAGWEVYTAEGYLLLYNVKSKHLKVMNIYHDYVTEAITYTRCFIIDKNKILQIFEAESYETEGSVKKIREIKIASNGEILIKSFKK